MSPINQIDGKIEAGGELYLSQRFWEELNEIYSQSLEKAVQPLIEAAQEPERLDWYDIRDYELSEERKDFRINDFPGEGDIVFVISYTGKAEIKFDSPNADTFDLETYKKLKHRYTELFLSNTKQEEGAKIKLLFGRGDWELTETIPEIDMAGTVRNDYLEEITDPLKIGQIIKDGHIVPHADIACEKILITGTTRLDQWRSTEDYTFIAPGKILLHATTKLSDWQHPSDTTYIHGGQIYTESIQTAALAALSIITEKLAAGAVTADKMTIADLADIKNLLTVAAEKILIGEDVLGADLHGIKIIDEQTPPVTRVAIGHLGAGLENYGIDIWDKDGTKWIEESSPVSLFKKIYDSELSDPATELAISPLNGNSDKVYLLLTKIWNTIAGDAPQPELQLRLNDDSDVNYGWQRLQGSNAAVSAGRVTGATVIPLTYYTAANRLGFAATWIFAKSGKARIVISNQMYDVTGTTVGWYRCLGGVWNNSEDNITQINIVANKVNGIGAGSHIVLYKTGD